MKMYRENGFPVTIIHPSHTYDERNVPIGVHGDKGSFQVLKRMLEGKPVIVHGDGTSLWTVTHNSDFAKGFTGLMRNPVSYTHLSIFRRMDFPGKLKILPEPSLTGRRMMARTLSLIHIFPQQNGIPKTGQTGTRWSVPFPQMLPSIRSNQNSETNKNGKRYSSPSFFCTSLITSFILSSIVTSYK